MFGNNYFSINKSMPEDGFGIYQTELDEINAGGGEYQIKQNGFDSIETDTPTVEDTLCTSGIGHLYCGVNNYYV